jgi:tripartite-type tricarboxylate transporter receptor subunit TctC
VFSLRASLLTLVASVALLVPAVPAVAAGAPWPEKPIRIVVPFAAGGVTDLAARIVARAMQKSLGQPVSVENRIGGDGAAAARFVKAAAPDGYTLFFATSSSLATPLVQKDAGFDPLEDFAAISTVGGFPYAMFVNAKVPVRTVQDLVAYGRTNKLGYGTVNTGEHLAATQFAKAAGIEMTRVPYNTSPMGDLAAGKIQVYIGPVGQGLAEARSGRVRLLATFTNERTPLTPSVPTLGEENLPLPSASLSHQMLLAPAKTPVEIVARLAREVQAAVGTPAVKAELQQVGLIPKASGAGELAKQLAEEQKTWKQFVVEAGLLPR